MGEADEVLKIACILLACLMCVVFWFSLLLSFSHIHMHSFSVICICQEEDGFM